MFSFFLRGGLPRIRKIIGGAPPQGLPDRKVSKRFAIFHAFIGFLEWVNKCAG